ncbi:hypothetical protein B0H19DRAFT_1373132 [Mycena capillaripes]|nr:hypothetical protein B0H19DRAFT_1373132 [Mycena capillaripes]
MPGPLGFWEAFLHRSTDYRKRFTQTTFAHQFGLDSSELNPYSLWRGVVVITFLTSFTYISIALLSLRHELFHWKPELLEKYLVDTKNSFFGRCLPESWLYYLFNIYESRHAKRTRDRIQNRDHRTSDDHHELAKIVRCLLRNLFVSSCVVFAMWMALLQTSFDSHNILKSPRSFVPPLQILVWHLITDTFYFFPHYVVHAPRGSKGIHHKILPNFLAEQLGSFLRNAHKTHHRSKANLAITAWQWWGRLLAGTATSVLAHTGFRTSWNDPGGHDEHHEYTFGQHAVNFGTAGFWDRVLGTKGTKSVEGARKWQQQQKYQAALTDASKRTGILLSREQELVVEQPMIDYEWIDSRVED